MISAVPTSLQACPARSLARLAWKGPSAALTSQPRFPARSRLCRVSKYLVTYLCRAFKIRSRRRLESLPIHGAYIAVFFDLRHFLAARPHHSERACKRCLRPGGTPSHDETATSVRASRRRTFAQAAAQRFVASISQESLPCVSLHALRHHRLRRCAARPAALTGWALLAGLPMIRCGCRWWPAQAGHQRRTGERTRFALIRLTYRSQISELALCSFFSSAARGRAPFGAEGSS